MTRIRANLVLLLAGAIWGMGFVAQSTAMEEIGPFLFVGLRFAVATLAILPLALRESARAETLLTRSDWQIFALIGVVLFGVMAAQQVGLLTTTVTNSGFLTGLYVIFTPLVAVAAFRQRPHPVIWPCALLALTGIWLLSGGGLATLTTGDWLTILCAFLIAVQVLLIGRYATRTGRPITLSVVQFAVTGTAGLAVAVTFEPIEWDAIAAAAPEILYAGVFSGGIAFTLQAIAQRYTTASQAAIFLSSEMVFAALFAAILLGERVGTAGLFGCALLFVAMLLVEIVPAWRRGRATA